MSASRSGWGRGVLGNLTCIVAGDPQRSEALVRGSDADRQTLTALLGRSNAVLRFCGRELIFFLWINSAHHPEALLTSY